MSNPHKIPAFVKSIASYGEHVYQVVLSCEKKFPRFKPGQFLHLTLDTFDPSLGFWPESRVFSIADVSTDRKDITIVYSVKGSYTSRMENELHPGKALWIKAPYGEFIISNFLNQENTIVLIAGGTGLAPFIPFLTQVQIENPIILFYGLRSPDLLLFSEHLQNYLDGTNHYLEIYLEAAGSIPVSGSNCEIEEGILSIPNILGYANMFPAPIFFLSGPPAMIHAFKTGLLNAGVDHCRVIIDEWS